MRACIGESVVSTGSARVTSTDITGTSSTCDNPAKLYVGILGSGTLNITEGGLVKNTDDGYIGYNASSTGTATVFGDRTEDRTEFLQTATVKTPSWSSKQHLQWRHRVGSVARPKIKWEI